MADHYDGAHGVRLIEKIAELILGIASIDAHVTEATMVPLLRHYGLLPEETQRTPRPTARGR